MLYGAKSRMGDGLQGAAADCNSAGETHAWFDSKVAHHPIIPLSVVRIGLAELLAVSFLTAFQVGEKQDKP